MRKKNVFRITVTCEKFAIIYIHILKTLYYYCNGKERREWNTNTNWLAVWHKIIIIMHSSSSSSSSSKLHEKKSVPIWCSACIRARRPAQCKISWCLFFRKKKIFPCPTKKKLGDAFISLIILRDTSNGIHAVVDFLLLWIMMCKSLNIIFFSLCSSSSIALILNLKITP